MDVVKTFHCTVQRFCTTSMCCTVLWFCTKYCAVQYMDFVKTYHCTVQGFCKKYYVVQYIKFALNNSLYDARDCVQNIVTSTLILYKTFHFTVQIL